MRARVLGAGAGGGFPQWNCDCRNCAGCRRGTLATRARTQASLAVTGSDAADGDARWLLLGASPDIGVQLQRTAALWPTGGARRSPVAAVAIPNGDVDAWLGLLSLREWTPLELLATPLVRRELVEHNAVMRTLDRFDGHTRWTELVPGRTVESCGLVVEPVALPGKPPVHMKGTRAPHVEDNIGFVVRDPRTQRSLAWMPSVKERSPALERVLREVDAIFFDGTFWYEDELERAQLGTARARDMGHWPVGGGDGSATFLATLPARDKWLVHVNNSNPLLDDDSDERRQLRALGLEVAHDGLEWNA